MIEHRLIERMVAVMDKYQKKIDGGQDPDPGLHDDIIDFLSFYADRCHHGKEEELLFRALADKPLTPDMRSDMERLVSDHEHSRKLTGELRELNERLRKGDGTVTEGISRILAELVLNYPDHIYREDRSFFPQAMKYLDPQEREVMLQAFADFDRRLIHEKYEKLVQGAERR
ncbi:MAG: cation-binding protein [Methanomassiliicoccus sp.]|jgi:hemerythrin-like domain-containing protein|nr:cation-binding protein [Methanomassiliicoccus sp.]